VTIRGVEGIVDALYARLVADLSTYIDAVNAEHTDGIVVPHPVDILEYVPPPSYLTAFPTIGVGHGPDRLEDDNGFDATGVYDLHLVAYLQDSDQRILAKMVRRMKLALQRCALEGRHLGTGTGTAWGVTYVAGDYGPLLSKNPSDNTPGTYMTSCAILIRCKGDEF